MPVGDTKFHVSHSHFIRSKIEIPIGHSDGASGISVLLPIKFALYIFIPCTIFY